jgi:hypothetical protein
LSGPQHCTPPADVLAQLAFETATAVRVTQPDAQQNALPVQSLSLVHAPPSTAPALELELLVLVELVPVELPAVELVLVEPALGLAPVELAALPST